MTGGLERLLSVFCRLCGAMWTRDDATPRGIPRRQGHRYLPPPPRAARAKDRWETNGQVLAEEGGRKRRSARWWDLAFALALSQPLWRPTRGPTAAYPTFAPSR